MIDVKCGESFVLASTNKYCTQWIKCVDCHPVNFNSETLNKLEDVADFQFISTSLVIGADNETAKGLYPIIADAFDHLEFGELLIRTKGRDLRFVEVVPVGMNFGDGGYGNEIDPIVVTWAYKVVSEQKTYSNFEIQVAFDEAIIEDLKLFANHSDVDS